MNEKRIRSIYSQFKMKRLLPSLREKKRYVVFELQSEKGLDLSDLEPKILDKIKSFLGIYGTSQAGIQMVRNLYKGNKGVIKVNNQYVDHLKAALTLIDYLEGQKVMIKSIGVSGILKKAQNKYIGG